MIEKMQKVMVVVRSDDRDTMLDAVRQLGLVHVAPVDAAQAAPDEDVKAAAGAAARALQLVNAVEPTGGKPNLAAADAVAEILERDRSRHDKHSQLSTLHRQVEQQAVWGDTRLEQLQQLSEAGVDVQFYSVPTRDAAQIEADCVQVTDAHVGDRVVVAVAQCSGAATLPESVEALQPPKKDNPTLRAEAAEIDGALRGDMDRLHELAHLCGEISTYADELAEQAEFSQAAHSGLAEEALFAVQGWIPAVKAGQVATVLTEANIDAAVELLDAAEDDIPPTLIRYPKWTRPIEGLFQVLGTVCGYKEFDVSAPFMIALPIFAAMLIGDGGYGAILCLGPLLLYKKVAPALGAQFTRLLIVIGAVALVWGFLCGSFFGVVLYEPPIPVNMTDASRNLLMKISFYMGAIHLSVAHLWQAFRFFPDLRFLCKVGWAAFIWGMLGVVQMFVLGGAMSWQTPWPYLLLVGGGLAILFDSPSKNVAKMILLGFANFPLSMLSAFGDVISYVRLMAVGLASGVLAGSFNALAFPGGEFGIITVPVLIFGHGLNLGLALIALFAHGVRLNMLEFSSNLGMQWSGYSYKPFAKR